MKNIKIFEPKFWDDLWVRTNSFSSIPINNLNEGKWIDFWNKISNIYSLRNKKEKELILKIVNFLENEKIISKESEVLDIGCGPGTYALPLAKKVKKVIAIDPAKKMLDIMMEEARNEAITNIVPLNYKWEDFNPSVKFDLVLASLTPAIRDTKSLLKMNNVSRKYACIITYFRTNEFKFRQELWQKIMKKPFHSITACQVIFPFNYLCTIGITPNIYFLNFEYYREEQIEELVFQYENYFKIFMKVDKNIKSKIYNYFKCYSKNGTIKYPVKRTVAIIWWNCQC